MDLGGVELSPSMAHTDPKDHHRNPNRNLLREMGQTQSNPRLALVKTKGPALPSLHRRLSPNDQPADQRSSLVKIQQPATHSLHYRPSPKPSS
jgi:hypothetical protein